MKLKPLVAIVAFALPAVAQAGLSANPGDYSTLATGTPGQRLQSISLGNPAATTFLIDTDENVRLRLLSLGSVSAEAFDLSTYMGDLTSTYDRIYDSENEQVDITNLLDEQETLFEMTEELGNDFYLETRAQLSLPFLPIAIRLPNQGVISASAKLYTEARLALLYSDLALDVSTGEPSVSTDTAAYLKEAAVAEFSLGYSQPVYESAWGTAHAGTRVNLYSAMLGKQLYGAAEAESGDIDELIESDYLANSVAHTPQAVGLDLGLIWEAPHYSLGLTLNNANQPEFNYGTLGESCLQYAEESVQANCFTALGQAENIALSETHTRHRQWIADVSVYTLSRHASLSTGIELNPTNSITGQPQQYASVGATYYKPNWKLAYLFTGARVGYTQNLVGNGLGYLTTGLTLFGGIDLDASFGGLGEIVAQTDDGELDFSSPFARQFSVALAFNEKF